MLGSGTALPDPHRGPAGFALHHDGGWWWIDGGSGTLQRSAQAGIDPLTLRGGIYSHHHPDHMGDLVPLLFAHMVAKRAEDYPIWAGQGFAAWFDAVAAPFGHWLDTPYTVHEIDRSGPQRVRLAPGLVLSTAPAVHSAAALHLRFDTEAGSVTFSGDTSPSASLAALARGTDLLVCECGGSDARPVRGHLTPSDVALLAQEARPGAVWLTHLSPHVDPDDALATVAATGIPARRAHDGDVWSPVSAPRPSG